MEKKFALSYLYMFIVVYTAQTDFYSEGIETRSSLYHRRIEFDGVQFTNSLLWTRDAVSKLQCARMCVDSGTCVSFTFTGPGSETRSCRAHSVIMTSSDTASDSAGTRYYVSANGIAEPSAQSTCKYTVRFEFVVSGQ
ncbi:hypothetical protein BaRGS_00022430 [Batillaria attramentaria]|uniref:Apple domain-containing protein n=1 Tax=Batillaria attramentaria TaxID=370345 RepID=A0ABD0KHJ1_9CAEN